MNDRRSWGSILVMAMGMALAVVTPALVVVAPARAADTQKPETQQRASEGARAESVRRAEGMATQGAIRSDRVHTWLRQARAQRKDARARCLDRMLSQVHAVERQLREEAAAIKARAARPEASLDQNEARMAILEARSRGLAADAYWCGRERSRRPKGPTTTKVKVTRPNLPDPPEVSRRSARPGRAATSRRGASR